MLFVLLFNDIDRGYIIKNTTRVKAVNELKEEINFPGVKS
jgi:hypothetical protein